MEFVELSQSSTLFIEDDQYTIMHYVYTERDHAPNYIP